MRNPDCKNYYQCLDEAAHKNKQFNCGDCKEIKIAPQEEMQMGDKIAKVAEEPKKKYCSKCGEDKPWDAFGLDKNSKDGKRRWCKICAAKAQRDRLAKKQGETNPTKKPVIKKPKPAEKHPDLYSLIAKLETHKAILVAELDRINTTISVIQERM